MKINNIEIKEGIDVLIEGISDGVFTNDEVVSRLGNIKLYALKTLKMAEIATRTNFDRDIEVRSVDIPSYIIEYIDIYKETFGEDGVDFEFINAEENFVRSISVLNLSIVIDNLISNSVKWGATKIKCSFNNIDSTRLELIFSDNGNGLSGSLIDNCKSIFELGVREEPPEGLSGSGIGLYYSKKLLNDMSADIDFIGNSIDLSGAAFKLTFI